VSGEEERRMVWLHGKRGRMKEDEKEGGREEGWGDEKH